MVRAEAPVHVCVDCMWMKHSKADWYRGWCEKHGHKINYINNCDSCNGYDKLEFLEYEDDEEYPDDFGVVEIKI